MVCAVTQLLCALVSKAKARAQASLLALLLCAWSLPSAHCAELFDNYQSVRALGMGNAFSAIVDNDDALFYNPANLCRVSGLELALANTGAKITDIVDAQDVVALQSATGSDFANQLSKFFGKNISGAVALKSAILLPCFEVAAWGQLMFSVQVDNPPYPSLTVANFTDAGAGAGVALDLVPNLLTLGLAARRINRLGAQLPIGLSTLGTLSGSTLSDKLAGSGTAYAFDGAVTLALPTPVRPTLTAVYHDVGNTTFLADSALPAPPPIKSDLTLGAGLDFDTTLLSIRPALDYKHVNDNDIQIGKKIHAGVEVAIPLFVVRGGIYQGYYTAGAGINLGILQINAATWGVELGEYPGQHESRRYAADVKVEIAFDADFGAFGRLFGLNKTSAADSVSRREDTIHRRRLKQRR